MCNVVIGKKFVLKNQNSQNHYAQGEILAFIGSKNGYKYYRVQTNLVNSLTGEVSVRTTERELAFINKLVFIQIFSSSKMQNCTANFEWV
jgi:hypothetical protein